MLLRSLLALALALNLVQLPAHAGVSATQGRLALIKELPSWEFFADNFLAAIYSDEDISFFKSELKKGGIDITEKLGAQIVNGVVSIPKYGIKVAILDGGKKVKVGGFVLALNPSEGLEQNYRRFEKILADQHAGRLFFPRAHASVLGGVVEIAGGIALLALLIAGAPASVLFGGSAALVALMLVDPKTKASPISDYTCHADNQGLDFPTRDGGKIVLNNIGSDQMEIQRLDTTGGKFILGGDKVTAVRAQLQEFGQLCPDDPVRHEQIRNYLARSQRKLAPKGNGVYRYRQ